MDKILRVHALVSSRYPKWKTLEERCQGKFVKRQEQECWPWIGAFNLKGYGYIMVEKTMILASRLTWFFVTGKSPGKLCVCHKCDNPSCVNPNHLFLGTKKDNAQDAQRKGRMIQKIGELHGMSKLTDSAVRQIFALRSRNTHLKTLAKMFHVSKATICRVLARKSWTHVHHVMPMPTRSSFAEPNG